MQGLSLFTGAASLSWVWGTGEEVGLQQYLQSEVITGGNWGTCFTSCGFKNPRLQRFSHPPTQQRHHGHRWSYCCPQGFCEELQVLGSKSQNHCSVDIPDVLGMWSLADLRNVAWLPTVEAETMMRVSLHWMGAIQVHGLGD